MKKIITVILLLMMFITGYALGLFALRDEAPGMPFFLPNGMILRLSLIHIAQKTDGVREAVVSFMTQKMKVEFGDCADEAAVMKKVLKNCKRVEDDCEISVSYTHLYSGAGKKGIAMYESDEKAPELFAPREYALNQEHKHLKDCLLYTSRCV